MADTKTDFSLVGCMREVPDPRAPYNQKHKFHDAFFWWTKSVAGKIEGVVASDGKTIRRSKDETKGNR